MRKFLFSCTMLAAFSANVAADPFVSGSEPGWGKHLSSAQRRTMGFEDVPAALKAAGYDNDPQPRGVAGPGVPGFVFNVLTIRHALHGHDNGSGGGVVVVAVVVILVVPILRLLQDLFRLKLRLFRLIKSGLSLSACSPLGRNAMPRVLSRSPSLMPKDGVSRINGQMRRCVQQRFLMAR